MNLFSFIPAFFELFGVYLLGSKRKWGFMVSLIGNILWIAYVILSDSTYGLLFVCVAAMVLNIRGFLHWQKT